MSLKIHGNRYRKLHATKNSDLRLKEELQTKNENEIKKIKLNENILQKEREQAFKRDKLERKRSEWKTTQV